VDSGAAGSDQTAIDTHDQSIGAGTMGSIPLPMSAPLRTQPPRVVLAHDWLVGMRGGEWVLDRLARLFGPTDLYTLVNDGRFLTDAIAACNVVTSPLQRFPRAAGKWRRAYLPLMPWAVERLRVSSRVGADGRCDSPHPGPLPKGEGVDLLMSTSSAVMKSIIPPRGVPHLCYCHSPVRYIWEQTEEYARGGGGWWRSIGLRAVRKRFQKWDRRTAQTVEMGGRVTEFIANSTHTAKRIERCYGREAVVIHPPVRTGFFTLDESAPREDWLLVVTALEPYKRTDIVIEAAKRAGFKLKIAGGGSQFDVLRKMANEGPPQASSLKPQAEPIEFLGRVSDDTLRDLYRRARALVFPQVEDFGIIAAEAQACGCRVIAYASGGALDIVTNRTGVLMHEQTSEAVVKAVAELQQRSIDSRACRANALRFSEDRFDKAILREVEMLLDRAR
jgi:glycosyltransferase involved in cell wall biosynthesis